jgi:hypothetical protein
MINKPGVLDDHVPEIPKKVLRTNPPEGSRIELVMKRDHEIFEIFFFYSGVRKSISMVSFSTLDERVGEDIRCLRNVSANVRKGLTHSRGRSDKVARSRHPCAEL